MRVFIYGSLKRGFFNHTRFGFDRKTRFIRESVLRGARMYDLGSYPCVVLTGDDNDLVYGEIYDYLDLECKESIRRMEIGAGYQEKIVTIDGEEMEIFVFPAPPSKPVIEGGRWEQ